MKRFMNNILTIVFIGSLVAAISCSNDTEEVSSKNETPVVVIEQGSATVRMFVPDYYALAEQGVSRAIAPQTTKARLSYSVNGSWVGINTVNLSDATKTPVENAPDGFTGSVYTCTFSGVPVGTYAVGNLQIELLDASGNTITAGTSTTDVTITKGGSASTVFYTLPLSTTEKVGNLAAGEMKFSQEFLYTGIKYKVSMKTSGDYPDVVVFSNDGKLLSYYSIDSAEDVAQIEVPTTDYYYIGAWADDGNKIGRYEYSFGKIEFVNKELYKGIPYNIDVTSDGAYPDVVLFKDGELVYYYTIANEADSHITLNVETSGSYTFVIYGNDTAEYSFAIDELKVFEVNLLKGIDYNFVIKTTKDYPNLALLNFTEHGANGELNNCQVLNYWTIKTEADCDRTISIDESGLYAFALVGKYPDAYAFAIDELKSFSANLTDGLEYNIKITTTDDYPNLAFMKSSMEGGLVVLDYWPISDESDCSRTISVDERGWYTFALVGKNLEAYDLQFDLSNGTEVKGTIPDAQLHWTEENSPYVITNNLWIPDDKVLVIDAGVVVQFTGNYYIKMNGVTKALGTAEKPIVFVNAATNQGNWNGIRVESSTGGLSLQSGYTYADGTIFKHCKFVGAETPLYLRSSAYVDNCLFAGNSNYVKLDSNNSLLINNVFDNGLFIDIGSPKVINNRIKSNLWLNGYAMIKNNTIENAGIYFDSGSYTFTGNTVKSSPIYRINDMHDGAKITGNNFLDYAYPSTIIDVSGSYYSSRKSYNFTSNYWGEEQTLELEEKGDNADISFFNDIYDDFNYTEVKYSGWATEPFERCGYSETGFVAFDFSVNGYDFGSDSGYYPESKNTTLQLRIIPQYCDSEITEMRVAQSYEELKKSDWMPYTKTLSYTVDKNKFLQGSAMVYMQVKDSAGNESASMVHAIPFDTPKVDLSVKDGTIFDNSIKKHTVSFSATDLCNIVAYSLSVDGTKVTSENSSWGSSLNGEYPLGLLYMASGSHTITMSVTDSAGNTGEKTVSFSINRDFDVSEFENISYDTATGQFLKDANTLHLWHLDNDGEEVGGTAAIGSYYHTNGGFEGAASSLSGNVALDISANAFTVEFWTRGSGKINVGKESVFDLHNYYGSPTSYHNYMYHHYTTSDSVSSSDIWASSSARARSDDQWHYWAYVYSGTYAAIYCDGVCVEYDEFTHTLNTNNNNLSISASCIVDELRVSSSARSADEISSYYKTAKPILDANTVPVTVIIW